MRRDVQEPERTGNGIANVYAVRTLVAMIDEWFDYCIDPARSGAAVSFRDEVPFIEFAGGEDYRDELVGLGGKGGEEVLGRALEALHAAGWRRDTISVFYAMADAWDNDPQRDYYRLGTALSTEHAAAQRLTQEAAEAGAPETAISELEKWRALAATLGGLFFPGLAIGHRRWRVFVRGLLRRALSPAQLALVETAWLLPVDHEHGFACLRQNPRPLPFPERPRPQRGEGAPVATMVEHWYDAARNQLKGIDALEMPGDWRRLHRVRDAKRQTIALEWRPSG